ncbi:MAG: helix-turn-helix transcriptional regulator [Clostridia bacterium]|nr:helix-turn-helix transcriptional regulator [Clostridia bacterium]
MDISRTLKYYRKVNGLTQQQISLAIGKERSCYAKYESGAATPPLETIEKLADIFNIPLAAILNNTLTSPSADAEKPMIFTAKSYQEQELLSLFRQLDDDQKKQVVDELRNNFLN